MIRAVGIGVVLLATGTALAGDWPQWRGVHRDGHAVGERLPAVWPGTPPAPLWHAAVGTGQASPVVAGGRVYILGRIAGAQEQCTCLDAATGRPIWSQRYEAAYEPADKRAGLGPKSTPLTDGDRVYFYGVAGRFQCRDAATGRLLWEHDCRREYWGVKKDKDGDDAWSTCCGAAASPLLDGDVVILPVGGEKAGAVTAFDRRTGALRWHSLTDRSSYASPIRAELAGRSQLVAFTGLRLVGLERAGGRLLWEHPFPAAFEQTVVTPLAWRDLVLVAGEKRPTLALRLRRDGDRLGKEVAWQSKDLRAYLVTPVIHRDRLIGLNETRGELVGVDLETGKTLWSEPNYPTYVSLVVAGDRLLVLRSDRELEVRRPSATGAELEARWRVGRDGETWSHLALADGRLYVKDAQTLYCFDVPGAARH